jgi:electron transfer flavoprotein beta subunit
MKILVPTKRIPDTDQTVHIDETGKGIVYMGLPYVINPFDAVALEEAVKISEHREEEVEVVVVGIGGEEYEQTLRTTLALGAHRALLVHCMDPLDSWNVATILQAIVLSESPDLVLMGKQAADDDANQAGQFLAALLAWPQATFASKLEFHSEGLRVERETDLGIETLSLPLPAVVTCELRLNEPRYASLPAIMKAKRKPLDRVELQDLGVALEPRVEIVSLESVHSARTCKYVDSAAELVAELRNKTDILK